MHESPLGMYGVACMYCTAQKPFQPPCLSQPLCQSHQSHNLAVGALNPKLSLQLRAVCCPEVTSADVSCFVVQV
jgi:hypothetical protein